MDSGRRSFFLRSAGVAVAVGSSAALAQQAVAQPSQAAAQAAQPDNPPAYVFFNANETAFVEAAVDRLIPADAEGPGALAAWVPHFIDLQLGGAWGAGERLYRSGPWQGGTPTQGYQLPFTPAELFRTALAALREETASRPFHQLSASAQDQFLRDLQTSDRSLGGVPAKVFFESLWALTLEGFFADPVYGGNHGMVGWKLIGFPGAYANYYHQVDQHGLAFNAAPVSLADNGHGGLQLHPDIPAHGGALPQQGGR